MSLYTEISARIRATLTSAKDLSSPAASIDLNVLAQMESGTGNNQADKIFSDTRQLAASGNETLDLTALTDDLGGAVNFAKVKAVLIRAKASNTNNVVVGAAGSNPFVGPMGGTTPTIAIPPGGAALLAAPKTGWSTTTASNLKFANSAAGSVVDYDIVILGTSA